MKLKQEPGAGVKDNFFHNEPQNRYIIATADNSLEHLSDPFLISKQNTVADHLCNSRK